MSPGQERIGDQGDWRNYCAMGEGRKANLINGGGRVFICNCAG
jgi:hypothetical protein